MSTEQSITGSQTKRETNVKGVSMEGTLDDLTELPPRHNLHGVLLLLLIVFRLSEYLLCPGIVLIILYGLFL